MELSKAIVVNTPEDSRHLYDANWRHQVAKAMVDYDTVCRSLADDYVYTQTAYLRLSKDPEMVDVLSDLLMDGCTDNILVQTHAANAIRSNVGVTCTKDRINALLMCPDLTYGDIARAFNMSEQVLERYEKLFFNVRDAEGKILPCKGILDYMALNGLPRLTSVQDHAAHWRVVAFESGHAALLNMWGWPEGDIVPSFTDYEAARHLMRQAFGRIEMAFRTGQGLDSRTFGSIFESINAKFSEYRDKGMLSGTETMSPEYLALQLLELMAPERLQPTQERNEERKRVLGDRLAALKSSTGADDAGNKSLEFIDVQNIEGK